MHCNDRCTAATDNCWMRCCKDRATAADGLIGSSLASSIFPADWQPPAGFVQKHLSKLPIIFPIAVVQKVKVFFQNCQIVQINLCKPFFFPHIWKLSQIKSSSLTLKTSISWRVASTDWWWTSNALPGVKTVNYHNYCIIWSRKSFINSSILLYGEQAMFYKALKLLITVRSQPACRSLLIYSFVAFSIGRKILNTNYNIEDQLCVICGCTVSFTDVHFLAVKRMYLWFEIRWQNVSHHSTVGVRSVQGLIGWNPLSYPTAAQS